MKYSIDELDMPIVSMKGILTWEEAHRICVKRQMERHKKAQEDAASARALFYSVVSMQESEAGKPLPGDGPDDSVD